MTDPSASDPTSRLAAIEARLDELERESDARRAALNQLAAQLPAAVSRRRVLATVVDDLRRAPDKATVVARGLRKLGRAPGSALRRLRGRRPGPR